MNAKLSDQNMMLKEDVENDLQKLLTHQAARSGLNTPLHTLGTILEKPDKADLIKVETDTGVIHCRKAASCLLVPGSGDTVLVSGPSASKAYIIAVVEQACREDQKIELPGRLTIAANDINLTSQSAFSLKSEDVTLKSTTATCAIEETRFAGKELNSTIGIVRHVGKVFETVVDRISHMCKRAFRFTKETEQVRMGTMDYQAENSARVHAKYTMVTAKDLVKVDSDQIHMG